MERFINALTSFFTVSLLFLHLSHAETSLTPHCEKRLKQISTSSQAKNISEICRSVKTLNSCVSRKGETIFHFENQGTHKEGHRILAFALIHGDEEASSSVALAWMDRLVQIESRNSWRIVPILNPDGWDKKTRTNGTGVDINRNFPTRDWESLALKHWRQKEKENKRRFPGETGGSEPETQCALAHMEEFKPTMIVSVHTPLGVLDFDGPKMPAPGNSPLRWVSLGNYPGSLGRYAWFERRLPVLTVELKHLSDASKSLQEFETLQDLTGTAAIQAGRLLKKENEKTTQKTIEKTPEKSPEKNLEAKVSLPQKSG